MHAPTHFRDRRADLIDRMSDGAEDKERFSRDDQAAVQKLVPCSSCQFVTGYSGNASRNSRTRFIGITR